MSGTASEGGEQKSAGPTSKAHAKERLDRQITLATWSGAIAAFMSFLATVGLVFLAGRQETATYDSVLLGQQVNSIGTYLKDFSLALSKALLVTGDKYTIQKFREDELPYRGLTNNLLASGSGLSVLFPDDIAKDIYAIGGQLQDVEQDVEVAFLHGDLEEKSINELRSKALGLTSNAILLENEMLGCFRKVLGSGRPINRDTVGSCDLSAGAKLRKGYND